MLTLKKLNAGYDFLQVLWGVSLHIEQGEYVSLLGPNGAGKTTTLKVISGLVSPMSGTVEFDGSSINHLPGNKVSRLGISYISEELNLFTAMTVEENLDMGAYMLRDRKRERKNLGFVYDLFPRLEERKNQLAGTLSGGERKMLAIGRAIMSEPRLLLVDEPSLGLAPQIVSGVFRALHLLNEKGVTILLVEQNVNIALHATVRGYVLEKGNIVLEGRSEDLIQDKHIKKVYLGV